MTRIAVIAVILAAIPLAACSRKKEQPSRDETHSEQPAPAAPTNRIDVPPAVRQNLGIVFAKVERRPVARTIRVPGSFELVPLARREYHAPLRGRVELLVEQYQRIEPGQPLYRLEAPGWRALQREIAEAQGALRRARAEQESLAPLQEAHARHRESLEANVQLWERRVTQLEQLREAGGGRASDWTQAHASLSQARADLADVIERSAEIQARRVQAEAELQNARTQLNLHLSDAAALLGVPARELATDFAPGESLEATHPAVEVRAVAPGVVESIATTNGGWVEETGLVLATAEPTMVRFRARGLQSDLGRLRDGLPARVVPPEGGSIAPEPLDGTLSIGLRADPEERTVDLLLTPSGPSTWARSGVSGFLEVTAERASSQELAIPLSAVMRDGLSSIIFRRDPKDPDRVTWIDADLGLNDGRWVVVKSGLKEGDEVVTDGAYQLMLASSGSAAKGGHFHADGTFHKGEDN